MCEEHSGLTHHSTLGALIMKSLFEILDALHSAGLRDEYLALRHYIDERDTLLDQQAFTVLAG